MSAHVPTATFVIGNVARELKVPAAEIVRGGRHCEAALARHVAMWIVRSFGELSYPKIASAFGLSDHTSVMHGCRKVASLMDRDREFRRSCMDLRSKIQSEWRCVPPVDRPLPPKPQIHPRPQRQRFPAPPPVSPRNDPARRSCLRCGSEFGSQHAGNRICPSCSEQNRRVPPGMETAV